MSSTRIHKSAGEIQQQWEDQKLFENTWGNINISDSRTLTTCMRNEITETSVETHAETYEENILR
jgi:hypothetical protein